MRSTKTYGHDLGLSCAFRQWRASSHCRLLHGYSLGFRLEFEAAELDENGWVVDFGSLKPVKAWLEALFDHKTLVAKDDPERERFVELHNAGLIELRSVDATGCEAFAKRTYEFVSEWLREVGYSPRVRLVSVEVREHGANSAIYMGDET